MDLLGTTRWTTRVRRRRGSEQVSSVLFKALLVIVLIGVVIALGTTIVVRALGLNEGASSRPGRVGLDRGDRAVADHRAAGAR